jgi:hypothetical protein
MESLKEGVKFVFNNKTILGALSLDMVAVLFIEQWHFTYFCSRYLKSRSRRLWGFRAAPAVGSFLTLIVCLCAYEQKMQV